MNSIQRFKQRCNRTGDVYKGVVDQQERLKETIVQFSFSPAVILPGH